MVEISEFIDSIWDEAVLDEFLNQLDYRINQIQQNPEIAPTYEGSEIRKLVIHKSVSLFYKNLPDHLQLLLLWDNRQDPAELTRKLNIRKH